MADKKETKKTETKAKTKKAEAKKAEAKKVKAKMDPSTVTVDTVKQLKADLAIARLEIMSGKSKDQKMVGSIKKDIARALTYLKQNEQSENGEAN